MLTKIINKKTKECLIMNQEDAKRKTEELELQEMEVEFGYDGKYYIKGYAPQRPIEEIKQEKIELLKFNCSNYIYSKYPIYKQLNIANSLATEEEILEMTTFIQKTRIICNDREEAINKAESVEEVEAIEIEFKEKIDKEDN